MTTTCPQMSEIHSSSHIWRQIVDQIHTEFNVTNNNLTPATLHQKFRVEKFGKQLMNKSLVFRSPCDVTIRSSFGLKAIVQTGSILLLKSHTTEK